MLVRYNTYLAIIVQLGVAVVCLGFAPGRERNPFRSFPQLPHRTDTLESIRGETTLWVETNDDGHPIHNDRLALDKLATRFTSRRKALILSGAAATAAAVATRTGASPIPGVPYEQQEGFSNSANGGGIGDDAHFNEKSNKATTLLESSSLYKVQTKSTRVLSPIAATSTAGIFAPPRPSVKKISHTGLLEDLQSKRAVFLGEHHPEGRDHRLQAALIRSLYNALGSGNASNATTATPLVVGLEAVQRQFQPVLDQYCEGRIDEEEVFQATEWESRWYWSFEAYKPILQTCRELGIGLLALDISTEDRCKVEEGGLKALDPDRLEEYIPDLEGFSAFGNTTAYQAFVSYTLKPPYELQQRTPLGKRTNKNNSISFSNFVARQMLRDEGMASAAEGWLSQNPHGILVGCIGINHATFGCGVPGRLEQRLSKTLSSPSSPSLVASVLINPEPLNTGTELKICPAQGQPPEDEEEDDDDYYPSSPRQIFVPNRRNQVCIQNSLEVQNYALQLEYLPAPSNRPGRRRKTAMDQATRMRQARRGETVLGLSDYLVFSPRDTND